MSHAIPSVINVSPFGKFRVVIETTEKKIPFKGMRDAGSNGYYKVYETIYTYSESFALKLKKAVEKHDHVKAATILPD